MKFLITLTLILTTFSYAEITPQGTGELHGNDHRFRVTAAKGWVLDTHSGVSSGVHMLFYPEGKQFDSSPIIIYGRYNPISKRPTINAQVQAVLDDFHAHGSPNYQAKKQPSITLDNGGSAELYFFTGDQWGNYEAGAYFKEDASINFLVFSTSGKTNFDKYLPDFITMVKSYQNRFDGALKKQFESQKAKAKKLLEQEGAKAYEAKIAQTVMQPMSKAIKTCNAKHDTGKSLDFLLPISRDGKAGKSLAYPKNLFTQCIQSTLSNMDFPAHQLDAYIFHLSLTLQP